MAEIGFTNYDVPEVETPLTTAEMIASLSAGERSSILNGFINKVLPRRLRKEIYIREDVIAHLYRRIDAIEEFCRSLLRGEIVDTPAEYDPETGEEITPATYVSPPTSLAALKLEVDNNFDTEFSAAQSGAIVDAMIAYSKSDGTGTTVYYLNEVVK